eukprot:m.3092 g.3092  ORF g.3092 m.3092 type:complete len:1786 (-) comp2016_c0_seq1:1998-7355(-)
MESVSSKSKDENEMEVNTAQIQDVLPYDTLFDVLLAVHTELKDPKLRKEKNIQEFVTTFARKIEDVEKCLVKKADFRIVKTIGKGAFGEVHVVRHITSKKVFAMKVLNKWDMLKRRESACFAEERDVLVLGDKKWITELHYAFQDADNLYLIMDYYSGGDLLTLLSKFEDRIEESMAQFYLAEMVEALHSIHQLGYVHRDIKPDNLLITKSGHIRLGDFGSCVKLDENGEVDSQVAVGTPDYISPEILMSMEKKGKYGREVDWWSLGVCMFEMLCGDSPFYSETLVGTYSKIMDHKNSLKFPEEEEWQISNAAMDMIKNLLCDASCRFGRHGIDDFKKHKFFEGVNWGNLHNETPPYIPTTSSATDTSNFDPVEEGNPNAPKAPEGRTFLGNHLPFVGYSFISPVAKFNESQLPSTELLVGERNSLRKKNLHRNNALLVTANQQLEQRILELESQLSAYRATPTETLTAASETPSTTPTTSTTTSTCPETNAAIMQAKVGLASNRSSSSSIVTATATKDTPSSSPISRSRPHSFMRRSGTDMNRSSFDLIEWKRRVAESEANSQKAAREMENLQRDLNDEKEKVSALTEELEMQKTKTAEAVSQWSQLQNKAHESSSEASTLVSQLTAAHSQIADLQREVDDLRLRKEFQAKALDKKEDEVIELEEKQERLMTQIRKLSRANDDLEDKNATLLETLSIKSKLVEELKSREASSSSRHGSNNLRLEEELKETHKQVVDLEQKLEQQAELHNIKVKEIEEELTHSHKQVRARETIVFEDKLGSLQDEYNRLVSKSAAAQDQMRQMHEEQMETAAQQANDHIKQLQQMVESLQKEASTAHASPMLQQDYDHAIRDLDASRVKIQKLDETIASLNVDIDAKDEELEGMQDEMDQLVATVDTQREQIDILQDKQPVNVLDQIELLQEQIQEYEDGNRDIENLKVMIEDELSSIRQLKSSPKAFVDNIYRQQRQKHKLERGQIQQLQHELSQEATAKTQAFNDLSAEKSKVVSLESKIKELSVEIESLKDALNELARPRKGSSSSSQLLGDESSYQAEESPQPSAETSFVFKVHQAELPLVEGKLMVPKRAGVKKGWVDGFCRVSNSIMFVYALEASLKRGESHRALLPVDAGHALAERTPRFIVDLIHGNVEVSKVTKNEAIHAHRSDISRIFKFKVFLPKTPLSFTLLFMCDDARRQQEWINRLNSYMHLAKQMAATPMIVQPSVVLSSSNSHEVKSVRCAAQVDSNTIIFGTSHGMYRCNLKHMDVVPFSEKKSFSGVSHIFVLAEQNLIVIVYGKTPLVRLFDLKACLRRGDEGQKLMNTKGCSLVCTGVLKGQAVVAALVKKTVIVIPVEPTGRPDAAREVSLSSPATMLKFVDGYLAVADDTQFTLYDCEKLRPQSLLAQGFENIEFALPENAQRFGLEPITILDVTAENSYREFILCYNKVGILVTEIGYPSRENPFVKWRCNAHSFHAQNNHLFCMDENHIEVISLTTREVVQVLYIPNMCLCNESQMIFSTIVGNQTYVIQIFNTGDDPLFALDHAIDYLPTTEDDDSVASSLGSSLSVSRPSLSKSSSRKFTFSVKGAKSQHALSSSRLDASTISRPQNFVHVQHQGEISSPQPQDKSEKMKDQLHGMLTSTPNTSSSRSKSFATMSSRIQNSSSWKDVGSPVSRTQSSHGGSMSNNVSKRGNIGGSNSTSHIVGVSMRGHTPEEKERRFTDFFNEMSAALEEDAMDEENRDDEDGYDDLVDVDVVAHEQFTNHSPPKRNSRTSAVVEDERTVKYFDTESV